MFAELVNNLRDLLGLDHIVADEQSLVESWKDALCVHVSGKWSAPVLRITSNLTNGFHAVSYTDMNALMPCIKKFDALGDCPDTILTDPNISKNPDVWKVLSELTAVISDTYPDEVPVIPSVDDIKRNIAEHKAMKLTQTLHDTTDKPTIKDVPTPVITDTQASIAKAVKQVFVNLCKELTADSTAGKKFNQYVKPFTGEFILEKLKEIHGKYGEDFEEACDKGDIEYICDTVDWSPLFEDEKRRNYFITKIETADEKSFETIRGHLNHLNSFTRVQEHIPAGMMNKIESYTSGLLTKLKNNEIKFADLDIEQIGKDVVDSSAEDDVEKMGENINELLPIIQRSGLFTQMMNNANK